MPVAGQGVVGADLECAASVVPDKCAVRSPEEALLLCLTTAECRGVTVFVNGECSRQQTGGPRWRSGGPAGEGRQRGWVE
jgi:hypothetical protein